MANLKKVVVMAAAMTVAFICGPQVVQAQVHHVVGEDRGWDTSTDVASWAVGRIFNVGDIIWFTYSAALENIVELRSKEEFESCDVSAPIKMYTDGLDKVLLDGEGSRYFASGNAESCKKGLKLPVNVMPKSTADNAVASRLGGVVVATPPVSPPSGSGRIKGSTSLALALTLFGGGVYLLAL